MKTTKYKNTEKIPKAFYSENTFNISFVSVFFFSFSYKNFIKIYDTVKRIWSPEEYTKDLITEIP